MKKLGYQVLLCVALAAVLLLGLLPGQAQATDPLLGLTVKSGMIYANGKDVVLKSGSSGYTMVQVGEQYVDFSGTDIKCNGSSGYDADLSSVWIFGGWENGGSGNTSVTLAGGTVYAIIGGSNLGNMTGDAVITVKAGSVKQIIAGGYVGSVNNSTVEITGGWVEQSVEVGGGNVTGHSKLAVTGGSVQTVRLSTYGSAASGSQLSLYDCGKIQNLQIDKQNIHNYMLLEGSRWTIKGDVSEVVELAVINQGQTLTVEADQTLNTQVQNYGTIYNYGTISAIVSGSGRITKEVAVTTQNCTVESSWDNEKENYQNNYTATIKPDSGYAVPAGQLQVQAGSKILTRDTDYIYDEATGKLTIQYSAMTAKVSITAKAVPDLGSEENTLTLTQTSYVYDGTAKKPQLRLNGAAVDTSWYTVVYENNQNAGTATAVFTGVEGKATGTARLTFTITGKPVHSLSWSTQELIYNGQGQSPKPVGKMGETTLVQGVDYTLTVTPRTDAGTYQATVTGKGNFTGSMVQTWEILPKSWSIREITVEGSEVTNIKVDGILPGDDAVPFGMVEKWEFGGYQASGNVGLQGADKDNYEKTREFIKNVFYPQEGKEYFVNSNDWLNEAFEVKAAEGFQVCTVPDGTFGSRIHVDSGTGNLTFYVKSKTYNYVSNPVTESYKVDQIAPTGSITMDGTSYTSFDTSGQTVFASKAVEVMLGGVDSGSGVEEIAYYLSKEAMTMEEIRVISPWKTGNVVNIPAKHEDSFFLYSRITDKAGNVTYLSADGRTFDTVAPKLQGVEEGGVYYVDAKVLVTEENLKSLTLNDEACQPGRDGRVTIPADADKECILKAVDLAGNETTVSFRMVTIATLGQPLAELKPETVGLDKAEAVEAVLQAIDGIDLTHATDGQSKALKQLQQQAQALQDRLEALQAAANTDAVTDTAQITEKNVTTADDENLKQALEDLKTLEEEFAGNLTEAEKKEIADRKAQLEKALELITALRAAVNTEAVTQTEAVTENNVTAEDAPALEQALEDLAAMEAQYAEHLSEVDAQAVAQRKQQLEKALELLRQVELTQAQISKLTLKAEPGDPEAIKAAMAARKLYDALNAHGRSMVKAQQLTDLEKMLTDYKIIQGDGSTWEDGEILSFTVNGNFDSFKEVLIDGEVLDSQHYTAKAGSTIITMKQSYLNKLKDGTYKLTVRYQNGEVHGSFHVKRAATPATGDIWMYAAGAVTLLSLVSITTITQVRKRKRG